MTSQIAAVLRYLRHAACAKEHADQNDARLLQQFVAQRSEGAFASVLQRHGPLVLAVCRRVLRDPTDAEDAFQATFLVLARKAGSIRNPNALAAWLHRVALNISRTIKAAAAQRQAHERQAVHMCQVTPVDEVELRDWQPLLHEEVERLPEKYRVPVILCYFKGMTHDEAARQLDWPIGTVKGRLARARDLLKTRLARRGLAITSAGLAAALAGSAATAEVPAALIGLTLRAVGSFAAGGWVSGGVVPARTVTLAKGALQTMNATKLVSMGAFLSVVTVIGVSTALSIDAGRAANSGTPGVEDRGPAPQAAPAVVAKKEPQEAPAGLKPIGQDSGQERAQRKKEPVMVVEGLSFEALVPNQIPLPAPGSTTDVDLWLRVTNVSDKPLTLWTFGVVRPRLYAANGKEVETSIGRNGQPRLTPPVILDPGVSWTWRPQAKLTRMKDGKTLLRGPDGLGVEGAWAFLALKEGKYRLVIEYANSRPKQGDVPLWVGKATTNAAEFEVVPADKAAENK